MGSPTAIEAAGDQFGLSPVGAGPFELDEWVPGDHVSLARNPDYWEEGRPYLDGVHIRPLTDPEARLNALNTGEADLALIPSRLGERVEVDATRIDFPVPAMGGSNLFLNTTRPPFDDVRARQALTYAIDWEALADTLGVPEDTYHPRAILMEGSRYFDPDTTFPEPDPARAQELLDELADEGAPLEFTYTGLDQGALTTEAVQAQLAAFDNITMNTESIPLSDQVLRLNDYDYDVAHNGYSGPEEPGLYYNFYSTSAQNRPGWKNTEVDRLIDLSRSTLDADVRGDAYQQIQRLVIDECVCIILLPGLTGSHWATSSIHDFQLVHQGPNWTEIWRGD